MIEHLHPGVILILGGLIAGALRGVPRALVVLLAPLAATGIVWGAPEGVIVRVEFLGYALTPYAVDKLSRLFALVFAIAAFGGALFALNQRSRLELPAALVYAGSAMGVTLAGDLLTVFVFWELMAIGSTLVIWSAGTSESGAASFRYLMIHLLGGVLLMAGIAGHVADTGSPAFGRIALDSTAHWLMLGGFLINAAAPPLSAWVPDAYPEASWSGTVFLSAFTTKTAVYVLLRGFPGAELLIFLGMVMVFYGIVYALLENDMRRILAYSIVSQVGFMVSGVGIGSETALNGVAAQALAHIIYKALLLMSAGSVLHMTGRRKCTELGGLFRSMPFTAACGMVGALSISAFPLTSGFVSKSMITQAAADGHLFVVWLLLGAASAGTFVYAGIKFPWLVFFRSDSGLRPKDPPFNMRLAMAFFAALCIGLGIFYAPLYRLLPFASAYAPYTASHVLAHLQLLLFAGLAFFMLQPVLRPARTITLDLDWLYRRFGPMVARACARGLSRALLALGAAAQDLRVQLLRWTLRWHGPEGPLARTITTGSMALWISVLLAAYLVVYYV
ncbi:MAG: Na(+)/H(+) antiporter subunit D [Betaproteobacteria bacterium]|nr:Na(+)/H(+) antiporter subunit D [Betaproteobacteria bacterium]MBI2960143.1 Na(+)/H(+) antiporter subunit D [Betaproteobacteria bacterium]